MNHKVTKKTMITLIRFLFYILLEKLGLRLLLLPHVQKEKMVVYDIFALISQSSFYMPTTILSTYILSIYRPLYISS